MVWLVGEIKLNAESIEDATFHKTLFMYLLNKLIFGASFVPGTILNTEKKRWSKYDLDSQSVQETAGETETDRTGGLSNVHFKKACTGYHVNKVVSSTQGVGIRKAAWPESSRKKAIS